MFQAAKQGDLVIGVDTAVPNPVKDNPLNLSPTRA
jgi:hypothetical protein